MKPLYERLLYCEAQIQLMANSINDNNSLEYHAQHGIEYKSVINRLFITKTTDNKYDLTLKPKIIILDMFPSFSHVEIQTSEGKPVQATYHYNFIIWGIFYAMQIVIFLSMLSSQEYDYASIAFIQAIAIIVFKFYGYKELKRISNSSLDGLNITEV